ncbi:cytochrome P450 [Puniceicoccaceae bacterium K14]|nr:cytochrome P450 [Puniceicoccaceae bacterium K14]
MTVRPSPLSVSNPFEIRRILRDRNFDVINLADYFTQLQTGSGHDLSHLIGLSNHVLFFLNGDAHLQGRRAWLPFFRSDNIRRWDDQIKEIVETVADTLPHGEDVDLVSAFASPAAATISCRVLGLPEEKRSTYDAWAEEIRWITEPMLSLNRLRKINQAVADFCTDLKPYVEQPIQLHPPSFISFITDKNRSNADTASVVWSVIALFIAGQSTRHTLTNALLRIAELAPSARAALLDPTESGPELDRVIQASGAVQYLARTARNPVDADSKSLAKGDQVNVQIASTERDATPRQCPFAQPNHSGDKTKAPQLAFGAGLHRCIGEELAKITLRHSLSAILKRSPNFRLSSAEIPWNQSKAIRSPAALFCSL